MLPNDTPEPTKQCTKCKEWLPATVRYFHKWSITPDGLRAQCKKCRLKHPERYLPPVQDGLKRCIRCKLEKPPTPDYFCKTAQRKDGLCPICRQCRNKTERVYLPPAQDGFKRCIICQQEKPATIEYFRRQTRSIGGLRARCKVCAPLHDKINVDQARASKRKYAQSHPEVDKVKVQRRIALRQSVPNIFVVSDWQSALAYFKNSCAACSRPVGLWHTLAMDHWIPLSSPGCPGTIPSNIIPLCHGVDGCTNQKSDKPGPAWLASKFGQRKGAAILARIEAYFASLPGHIELP